jgi:hypothetical protein
MTGEIPRVLDSQELGTREALRKVASPQERNARVAFTAEQAIKQDIHEIRVKWVELAAKLTDFIDNERYIALGFTTIQEWLAQPEINISMQKLYAYTQMYREWIVKRQVDAERLADMSMQSLREVTPSVRLGRIDPESALADAESLSRSDLRERYKSHLPAVSGLQDARDEPLYFTCSACGSRVRRKDA